MISSSDNPNLRQTTNPHTVIRVLRMQASPPHTPGVLRIQEPHSGSGASGRRASGAVRRMGGFSSRDYTNSRADVARVQTPRQRFVGGAVDDGAAVGEEGEVVAVDAGAEDEGVTLNLDETL